MKNYIEEFEKENNIKDDKMIEFNLSSCSWLEIKQEDKTLFFDILSGIVKWNIVKPKSLMEQLKEQGFGWMIKQGGNVYRIPYTDGSLEGYVQQGNIKLTKSDAEREVYRRGLEFEMQEWARENECLGDVGEGVEGYCEFNVRFVQYGNMIKCYEIFKDKIDKYYNWS